MPDTITSFKIFRPGETATASDFNSNFSNLRGTRVPIDPTSAAAVNETYSLGNEERKFKRAYITSGYFSTGDIKAHYSFNGHASAGQGWMLCDGRKITQANYDAEHGSGSWETYVGSSALEDRFLPNLVNRYLVGVGTTTSNGVGTLASVGVTTMAIDLTHSHTIASHKHGWYVAYNTSTSTDTTFDSSRNSLQITPGTAAGAGIMAMDGPTLFPVVSPAGTYYTDSEQLDSNQASLSITSIQPTSIEVEYYMLVL